MAMPRQKPGRSKQDYGTPPEFLDAALLKLCIQRFDADLAASDTNAVAYPYFTEQNSAFDADHWMMGAGWNWLNPPFAHIEPWVQRTYTESLYGVHTAVLVPASVGANWWKAYVHGYAKVLFLNGRITFVGCDGPYPKDCALLLYGPSVVEGYDVWTWPQ